MRPRVPHRAIPNILPGRPGPAFAVWVPDTENRVGLSRQGA